MMVQACCSIIALTRRALRPDGGLLRHSSELATSPRADTTLERTPLADPVLHLEDAVASNPPNPALAEAVRLEFARRPDVPNETTAEFGRAMNRLVYPSANALAKLREVRGSASMADVKISEFLRGQSNPAGRISAARRMGVAA